ncbi:MAG: DUF924 family protein [Rhodospirillaceae bacterium]|nr:DUF924 family protein [Rhodospirillaceae bacterium]MBT3490927.1 DUF924 family protein [Rhodospirillaceae bacterium]MBT3780943.1 DUF924 family protein [Rhodospirillaceae bacterium]MBT3978339.1 DUF924 family protein [Rhodospirillaceae bacterium]MBT4170579.1 DUF924 family protein [Rhodospirillaceae bacterium]
MQESTEDPIPTSDFGGQKPQSDIPFAVRRRINWGDTDTAEITYTGKFIDFGIDAMEVWYEAVLGQTWHQMKQDNLANPAVSLQYDFHSTLVVGDRFDATVYVERLGRTSLTHRIEMTKVGGPLVCTGTYTAALVRDVQSPNIKAHPFPTDWRERIEGYVRECALRETGVKSRREVLDFWFGRPGSPERGQPREIWFARQDAGGSEFDAEIREKFAATVAAAAAGQLDHWAHSLEGALALLILLDQFSRNIHRGTAQAFANDTKALDFAKRAVAAGWHEGLDIQPKKFLIMPFQHCEDLASQEKGIVLFAALRGSESGDKSYDSMLKHRDIIAKYGRFPHRNAALGRSNTPEEEEYLSDPEAGF